MIDALYLPAKPAIIIPSDDRGPFAEMHRTLAARGVPRRVRLAVERELRRLAGVRPAILRPAISDLDRFASHHAMLPGLGVGAMCGGGGGLTSVPVAISFASHAVDATNASAYTFSSQALGTAASTRYIVIAVDGVSNVALRSLTSVTLDFGTGAQALTNLVTASSSAGGAFAVTAIGIVAAPTGTTGTVVVTWDNTQLRTGIGIWAVNNINGSASNTQTSTASTGSVTLSVPANGGGIAAIEGTTGGTSYTWSGLTEDYDENVEAGTYHSGASALSATAQSLSVTATPSSAMTVSAMAAVAFAPA